MSVGFSRKSSTLTIYYIVSFKVPFACFAAQASLGIAVIYIHVRTFDSWQFLPTLWLDFTSVSSRLHRIVEQPLVSNQSERCS